MAQEGPPTRVSVGHCRRDGTRRDRAMSGIQTAGRDISRCILADDEPGLLRGLTWRGSRRLTRAHSAGEAHAASSITGTSTVRRYRAASLTSLTVRLARSTLTSSTYGPGDHSTSISRSSVNRSAGDNASTVSSWRALTPVTATLPAPPSGTLRSEVGDDAVAGALVAQSRADLVEGLLGGRVECEVVEVTSTQHLRDATAMLVGPAITRWPGSMRRFR